MHTNARSKRQHASIADLSAPQGAIGRLLQWLVANAKYHAYTVLLFTWRDYTTIFLPISIFACCAAPLCSVAHLVRGCFWIWTHLLMCDVSGQYRNKEEDLLERPWRPVPSGRISYSHAVVLRWALVLFCLFWSIWCNKALVPATLSLVATTFIHIELELSRHPIGKNLCNVVAYMSFEVGATKVMGAQGCLDDISLKAVILSGMIIFTTIHAQDFPDVEGDAAVGRITFPIYSPELSRVSTLMALVFWSVALSRIWSIPPLAALTFTCLGCYVGFRYYAHRHRKSDRRSYELYNVGIELSRTEEVATDECVFH